MTDFNRKVEEASALVNKSVGEAAERVEKETAEFIKYLNNEVVPAVRQHSTKALRIASEKLAQMAKYLEEHQNSKNNCAAYCVSLPHSPAYRVWPAQTSANESSITALGRPIALRSPPRPTTFKTLS